MSPETQARYAEVFRSIRQNPPGPPGVDPMDVIDYLRNFPKPEVVLSRTLTPEQHRRLDEEARLQAQDNPLQIVDYLDLLKPSPKQE